MTKELSNGAVAKHFCLLITANVSINGVCRTIGVFLSFGEI